MAPQSNHSSRMSATEYMTPARKLIRWTAATARMALRDEKPDPAIVREALAHELAKARPRKRMVAALEAYLAPANGYGGARPGAGAKPTVPGGIRSSVKLTQDSWYRLGAEAQRRGKASSVSAVVESLAQTLPAA